MAKPISLHKATVRTGAFTIPGAHYNGDLPLARVIADFLVAKQLVTTEDYCNFSLGVADVSFNFAYDDETQVISLTINGETQSHTLQFDTSQISTSNSLVINGVSYPAGTILQTILAALVAYINSVSSSSLILYSEFTDDLDAAVGGVPVGGVYSLATDNPYGMAHGVLKVRID